MLYSGTVGKSRSSLQAFDVNLTEAVQMLLICKSCRSITTMYRLTLTYYSYFVCGQKPLEA